MMRLLRGVRSAVTLPRGRAAGPLSHHAGRADLPVAHRSDCAVIPDNRPFPAALDPFVCNRYEIAEFGEGSRGARGPLSRRVLRRGAASRARPRGGLGRRPPGEPLLPRHVEAHPLRHGRAAASGRPRVRTDLPAFHGRLSGSSPGCPRARLAERRESPGRPAVCRQGSRDPVRRRGERWERPGFSSSSAPIHDATTFVYDRAEDLDGVVSRRKPGYS